jgi:hypothetical protein
MQILLKIKTENNRSWNSWYKYLWQKYSITIAKSNFTCLKILKSNNKYINNYLTMYYSIVLEFKSVKNQIWRIKLS